MLFATACCRKTEIKDSSETLKGRPILYIFLKINDILFNLALRICGIKSFNPFKSSNGAEICLQDACVKTLIGFVFVRRKKRIIMHDDHRTRSYGR